MNEKVREEMEEMQERSFEEVEAERESEEPQPEIVIPYYEGQDEESITVTDEKLNWREAAKKLKSEVEKNKNDFTIDTYFVKIKVAGLRERYNNKERSVALHAEIMILK